MQETTSAEVAGVPESVLDELAQTLADKLDILLDRLTDRALTAPDAGTPQWHTHWHERDSDAGRRHAAQRLYVRAVLARRAGIGLQEPTAALPVTDAALSPPVRRRPRRSRWVDDNQLSIF